MKFQDLLYIINLLCYFIQQTATEQCLQQTEDKRLPQFQDYGEVQRITRHHQAIIPSYKFRGSGNITKWGVDVDPAQVGSDDGKYTLDLQVWRPSPTVNDSTGAGQYSLVGNNRFTSISLSGGVAIVTPSPQDQIHFQSGDVLGFYVESAHNENRGVAVITSGSFSNHLIWYAILAPSNTDTFFSVGSSSGHLNTWLHGAPVVSVQAGLKCNTQQNGVPSSGSGRENVGVIVGVVLGIFIILLFLIVTSFIIFFILSKRRKRTLTFGITNNNNRSRTAAINNSNERYVAQKNPTCDYVEVDESQTVHCSPATESSNSKIRAQSGCSKEEKAVYSSTVSRSKPIDPVYEDPQALEKAKHKCRKVQNVFDDAGTHVPSEEERRANKTYHSVGYSKLRFFVEELVYWTPASTTSDLYSQLASKKYREIDRNQITMSEEIGSGAFGEVCRAIWSISGATKELAVKTLRAELPEEEKVRFLQEAAIMGQFSHPNVIKLYGVVTVGEPVMLCIELMTNGDLRDYLCLVTIDKKKQREFELRLLQFSKQIASGMNYLSKKSFVHRDLAARNVLLDGALTCKIGDFGSARDLVYETYYTPKNKGGVIPVKWTAPEALLYKKYSTDSDVWSFGMVLFEIWSVGKKPFSRFSNSEVIKKVNKGYNQPPPPGCPRAIYQLMVDCWHPAHSKRPSFSKIVSYLSSSCDLLLQWVEEEETMSVRSRELGVPLSEAESLFKDLQNVYTDISEKD